MNKLILTIAISLLFQNVVLSQLISDNLKGKKLTKVENEVGFKSFYTGDTLISKEYSYVKRSFPFFRFKVLKEGIYYAYYPNGNIKEVGAYHKGMRVGYWQEFSEDGRLDSEYMYDRKGNLLEYKNHIDEKTRMKDLLEKLEKGKTEK